MWVWIWLVCAHAQPFLEGQLITGHNVSVTLLGGAYDDLHTNKQAGAPVAFEMTWTIPGWGPPEVLTVSDYHIRRAAISGAHLGPNARWSYDFQISGLNHNGVEVTLEVRVAHGSVTQANAILRGSSNSGTHTIGLSILNFNQQLGIGFKAAFNGVTGILPSPGLGPGASVAPEAPKKPEPKRANWDVDYYAIARKAPKLPTDFGMNDALWSAIARARDEYIEQVRGQLRSSLTAVKWADAIKVAIEPYFYADKPGTMHDPADFFVARFWVSQSLLPKLNPGGAAEVTRAFTRDGGNHDCDAALLP